MPILIIQEVFAIGISGLMLGMFVMVVYDIAFHQ